MLYRACEVCGEKFNLLTLDSTGENKYDIMCECQKCKTKYKVSKINKKKVYVATIPLAIICVLGYVLFDLYLVVDLFYAKVIIACVLFIPGVIIFINHVKNLKFEKIDESDIGNTNEQSSHHSK